jgi:hypothetical protein
MPFYTGKSADGSDMREVQGMHTSPNDIYWGSEPISLETEREWMIRDGKIKGNRAERRALKFKGKLNKYK